MNCSRARSILGARTGPASNSDVLAAREHVGSCGACREHLAFDPALARRLRALRLPAAPPELVERISRALEAERDRTSGTSAPTSRGPPQTRSKALGAEDALSSSRRRSLAALAAAAAVVLIAGSWLALGGPTSGGDAPSPDTAQSPGAGATFVEDFVRTAVPEEVIASDEPAEVQEFVWRELGLNWRPPTFPGFRLVGAEICISDTKRGAVIMYERNGDMLYHYLVQVADASPQAPGTSHALPPMWEGRSPPAVAIWATDGLEEAIVADIERDEALALAQAIHTGRTGS